MKYRLKRALIIITAAVGISVSTVPVFAENNASEDRKLTVKADAQTADKTLDQYCNEAMASMNLNGKTWKEKADAITDYVSWNFRYDTNYQSTEDMFRHGGGDCWASTNMICELGKRAGFAATPRYANIDPLAAGVGHENALLQDPDDNVYLCEAGWVRQPHEMHGLTEQIGSKDKLAYDYQPYQIYQYADSSRKTYTHTKPYFDKHIIGMIYNFNNTVIQIPTDSSITTIGYDRDTIVKDHNSDPDNDIKIEQDDAGNWMVDATIGDSGWFQHQFYYDPFMLCKVLQTVKVGNNIVKISDTALKGTYEDEHKTIKFEIDPANPVYTSTSDGGIVLKVNNDQGKAGTKIYTPGGNTPVQTTPAPTSKPTPAPTAQPANNNQTVVMYRAYNPYSGEHFYTSNRSEFNHLVSLGWRDEGTGWIAPAKSNTPVYRLYNKYGGEHHYTTNVKERDNLIKAGWRNEGIGWYSDDQKRTPVYREYNPNAFANNHNYTTSKTENDHLVSLGWKYEGIGWYGLRAK